MRDSSSPPSYSPLEPRRRAPSDRWMHVSLVIAGVIVLAMIGWFIERSRAGRQVQALDPAERAELYARTLENFRADCGADPPLVPERCEQHAAFLASFPECDSTCWSEIARFLPKPTR